MNRAVRAACVAGTASVAAAALFVAGSSAEAQLLILGAALVVGELFELRPANRPALPLSFAVVVVLVRAASPTQFVVVVCTGYLIAASLRVNPDRLVERSLILAQRVAGALSAVLAYHAVLDLTRGADARATILSALVATVIAQIVVYDVTSAALDHSLALSRERAADIALSASAILMAVSYRGIAGEGRLGLWGPALFSILLLAAWYSFELLAATRSSFRQTVRALGVAPELGGLVRSGHVERVADLAVAIGAELDLPPADLEHLETAALLHHLGAVCLDEPAPGSTHDPSEVAKAGAQMLRASEALAPAGDIVAAEPLLHRSPTARDSSPTALAGQVLKVASAFDELTEGDPEHAAWAVEALFTGPSYVYDGRVLDALERVAVRRGLLTV